MHPPDYLNGSTYLYSNMMITGGDRPKNLNESRGSPMVASSAVVQDAEVEVQTAVQHFWTPLHPLPIRSLPTHVAQIEVTRIY